MAQPSSKEERGGDQRLRHFALLSRMAREEEEEEGEAERKNRNFAR